MTGHEPGIIGYLNNEPIAWCAVAPRDNYIALERSRILKPVDDQPVWSVSCLFIKKPYRRQGVSAQALQAAIAFAASHCASIVEGYPVEPPMDTIPDPFLWHGIASAFLAAGFTEVARRSNSRPIMRYEVNNPIHASRRKRSVRSKPPSTANI